MDTIDLRDLGESISEEQQRPASPVTPEEPSRPQTPETPGPPQTPRRVTFEMTDTQGPTGAQLPANVNITTDQLVQLLAQVRPIDEGRRQHAKVEDPELYYGERQKLRSYLTQCELKFNCEQSKFINDAEKVNYASSRCRGNAWLWIEPSIVNGRSTYTTWLEFKTAITRAFGEADAKDVARRKFKACRQGTRSAAAYWAEFQRITADLRYGEDVCIDQFYDGLNTDVQRQLALIETLPTEMVAYANRAIALDNRLYNFKTLRTRNEPQYAQNYQNPRTTAPERNPSDPEPMELDATRRNTFNRNRTNTTRPRGNCFSCGKPGHFAKDCPGRRPQYRRPYRAAEASYEQEEEYEPSGKVNPQE